MKKLFLFGVPLAVIAIVVAVAFAFRLTQLSQAEEPVNLELPKPYTITSKKPTGGFGSTKTAVVTASPSAQKETTGSKEGNSLIDQLNSVPDTGNADIQEMASSAANL